jgi:cell division protein ZapA
MDSADTPKKTVRVTIFNQSYTLATAGDPADTERLAMEIDDLMSSIARRAGNLDATRTAVLACLHLADQLRSVEKELTELKRSVDDRTRDFALLLDEVLSPSSR